MYVCAAPCLMYHNQVYYLQYVLYTTAVRLVQTHGGCSFVGNRALLVRAHGICSLVHWVRRVVQSQTILFICSILPSRNASKLSIAKQPQPSSCVVLLASSKSGSGRTSCASSLLSWGWGYGNHINKLSLPPCCARQKRPKLNENKIVARRSSYICALF